MICMVSVGSHILSILSMGQHSTGISPSFFFIMYAISLLYVKIRGACGGRREPHIWARPKREGSSVGR